MNTTSQKSPSLPMINSSWKFSDYLGELKVRMSISRNAYKVNPGLYKLGSPDASSDVFVTANYKLSFDLLRKNLAGRSAWILILDTNGINVWCAAGKGTFGTEELIRKINDTKLYEYIRHKKLIVPQLGAPGIAAYKVKNATGFTVKFGPVRAADIPEYIKNNYRKDESMRIKKFDLIDRLVLVPVEMANSLKILMLVLLGFFILSLVSIHGIADANSISRGIESSIFILAAYISGTLLGPLLLPWLPFRSFSAKGIVAGIIGFAVVELMSGYNGNYLRLSAFLLLSIAIASFLTMNFTGASTYTSLSGVKKEMKLFIPVQIGTAALGLIGIIISQMI